MNRLDFEGRTAVVTGGAAGIGLAIAKRLALSGARVALWDLDARALAAAAAGLGHGTYTHPVDVADAGAVARAAAATARELGRLDVLVCSAGIAGPNSTTWDYPVDEWKRVFDVNVNGLFYCNRAVVPEMMKHDYGRIVNIASVAANEGPKNLGAYAASKAGVVGLTKSMGKDLAGSGVLVNAVTPALIATDMMKQITPEYYAAALARIPLGRPGTLDEAAALVTWLCSEECSFSTGACYDLSGGRGL